MPNLFVLTQPQNLRELFGNSIVYKVPPFQRNYSWGKTEWEELWDDLQTAVSNPKSNGHYMGYVVLRDDADKTRERTIIDGQQRLVTLSLLIMAGARLLKDKERRDNLLASYLTPRKKVSEDPVSRLQLNRVNDVFYNRLLRGNTPSTARADKSNKQMLHALEYFQEKMSAAFTGENADDDITRFIDEQIAELVIFTVLAVDEEEAAYAVFETLNARGVELSSPDLVKNHLFSIVDREEPENLRPLENSWEEIIGALRPGDIMEFLRCYWMSRRGGIVRKKELYRGIRSALKSREEDVFPFLEEMREAADLYMAMCNPSSGEWSPEEKRQLDALNICKAKQHLPLLLAARKHWGQSGEFAALARWCAVIAFRRSVCDRNPNELERAFVSEATRAILEGAKTAGDLARCMQKQYPDDDIFETGFAKYSFSSSTSKLAKFVMLALEKGNYGAADDAACTLEHILPQNPGGEWREFDDAYHHQNFVWRIGNLALLSAKDNRREAANKGFADKRDILGGSDFGVTKELANYDEWSANSIETRQKQLAKKALGIWSIQFPTSP